MYDKQIISQPWSGWVDAQPALTLPPSSFKKITNWVINKGRIQSCPKANAFVGPPNGENILGGRTFIDVLSTLHTLILTKDQAYFLNNTNNYTLAGAPFSPPSALPFALDVMLNKVFFANGGQNVSYVDGSNLVTIAGDVPGSCYYLGKLAAHLIMAFTVEPDATHTSAQGFPNRVRWSKSGDPLSWFDFTAGFEDIADVEDQLTGFANLGYAGFLFRNNGITVMSPTGVGSAPFRFDNFSIGPTGIGCSIPYSLASYGNFCMFMGLDDIYYFDSSGPQRVGGTAKKSIFKDLFSRSGTVSAFITGSLGKGIDYLAYWLCIPQTNNTRTSVWIYHFDDGTWVNESFPFGRITFLGDLAIV